MKRSYKRESILKMADDLGYNIYTDCGRVYLSKGDKVIVKKGFVKTYDYLYNIRKKLIA